MAENACVAVNPCKMCQPLGALFALKGIGRTVVLLHGSQGCTTYMRRHMAGHFNEPIDVASSSLSENGAVYGGEANLRQGLRNVIKSYQPELVGVVTTCLSETIGDDVERIVKDFAREEGATERVAIVPVSTPSYMGTQRQGFKAALVSLLEHCVVLEGRPNGRVNLMGGNISPADARYLKVILHFMEMPYTLLPDVSETLDAPMQEEFKPIPEGGTRLSDIQGMGDSVATIECGYACERSAADYLEEVYGVPAFKMGLSVGLSGTDRFLEILCEVSGNPMPECLKKERGRLLDAMVDAHKVLFGRRALIYGEEDLVEALTAFTLELGMEPSVVASGGGDDGFERRLGTLFEKAGRQDLRPRVLQRADFDQIHRATVEVKPDLLIGNSEGRHISESEGVPLVRVGFPIHDRLGGQRQLTLGYEGAMNLIELMANPLLEIEHRKYRAEARRLMGRDPEK